MRFGRHPSPFFIVQWKSYWKLLSEVQHADGPEDWLKERDSVTMLAAGDQPQAVDFAAEGERELLRLRELLQ